MINLVGASCPVFWTCSESGWTVVVTVTFIGTQYRTLSYRQVDWLAGWWVSCVKNTNFYCHAVPCNETELAPLYWCVISSGRAVSYLKQSQSLTAQSPFKKSRLLDSSTGTRSQNAKEEGREKEIHSDGNGGAAGGEDSSFDKPIKPLGSASSFMCALRHALGRQYSLTRGNKRRKGEDIIKEAARFDRLICQLTSSWSIIWVGTFRSVAEEALQQTDRQTDGEGKRTGE